MRLVIFDELKLGVLKDGQVYDVSDVVGARADEWPPIFWVRAIANFGQLRPKIEAALSKAKARPLEAVRLRASALYPSKVIAAPANYRLHIEEMQRVAKEHAPEMKEVHAIERYGVFLKAPSSIIGPGGTIELPFPNRRTDHEVELGVVIGKTARNVKAAEAMDYVFGYTGVLDITVRGDEDRSTRKSFDTFTPVGPVLVTKDEMPDPQNIQLKLWVNGEPRQHGNTRDMIWGIPRLIEYASHVMTLFPGDVFTTGTPDGVGPLAPGDEVTMEVERIGRMTVRVEAK